MAMVNCLYFLVEIMLAFIYCYITDGSLCLKTSFAELQRVKMCALEQRYSQSQGSVVIMKLQVVCCRYLQPSLQLPSQLQSTTATQLLPNNTALLTESNACGVNSLPSVIMQQSCSLSTGEGAISLADVPPPWIVHYAAVRWLRVKPVRDESTAELTEVNLHHV